MKHFMISLSSKHYVIIINFFILIIYASNEITKITNHLSEFILNYDVDWRGWSEITIFDIDQIDKLIKNDLIET
jgi:hypothetical protein